MLKTDLVEVGSGEGTEKTEKMKDCQLKIIETER